MENSNLKVPIPVNVYAESTPNPAAMKFVCNLLLMKDGSVTYNRPSEASACPLAAQLFSFTGVKSVFIATNFITITKPDDIDWFEITNILREFIRGYLMSGERVFVSDPMLQQDAINAAVKTDNQDSQQARENSAVEAQIMQMLDEFVKPAVEQDGGAIHFRSFNEGIVTVVLKGSCSGCPSSTVTLKSGIENLLKQMVPEVKGVIAES